MCVDRFHIVSLFLSNPCTPSNLSKEVFVYFVCPTEITQPAFAWKYYQSLTPIVLFGILLLFHSTPWGLYLKNQVLKQRLLAWWKRACTISNHQNCFQSWHDFLSPRHPFSAHAGICPGALELPPVDGVEAIMDYITWNIWSISPRGTLKVISLSLHS